MLAVDYLFMIFFAPTWLMLYHIHFSDQVSSLLLSSVIQKSMSLKYEPSSEPLHISAKDLF